MARLYGCLNGLDIERKIGAAGDVNHARGVDGGVEGVHAEGGRAVHDCVARLEEQAYDEVNQFIRAAAREEVFHREAGEPGERGAQGRVFGVRVNVRLLEIRDCGEGLRAGAVGVLVRVELDDVARVTAQARGEDVEWHDGRVRAHREDVRAEEG